MYVKLYANGEVEQFPYTLGDLRRDNPQTSFPRRIGDATCASFGMYHVIPTDKPTHEPLTQTIAQGSTPVKETAVKQDGDEFPADVAVGDTYETGRWTVGWTVSDLEADVAARNVRRTRDAKLAACDWMANSDVTMSDAWRTYRQALRDVPSQLPSTTITWPTEPS